MTIVTPTPEIDRDRYGRPLVVPPNGGRAVAYTRCTTYIDCLEDKFTLQKWQQRMVATGLASRPDLLLAVSAHRDDKAALDRICTDAREAAAASAAATTGTALHALTELVDRGQELPVLPDSAAADLAAYAAATSALKAVLIEQFCVLDELKIGGTPDRVVELDGRRYIADIKTGSIEWGTLKIAQQLAVYSRSATYDVATGARGEHGADRSRGIIIHLPAGEARATLHWVDLDAGWAAVQTATAVREHRKLKFGQLTTPLDVAQGELVAVKPTERAASPTPATTGNPNRSLMSRLNATARATAKTMREQLAEQITTCADADAVRALWAANQDVWTQALTDAATAHIATLGDPKPPAVA